MHCFAGSSGAWGFKQMYLQESHRRGPGSHHIWYLGSHCPTAAGVRCVCEYTQRKKTQQDISSLLQV